MMEERSDCPAAASYRPLSGVRVLDMGILIPPSLTSAKLVAMGADVVKIEQPGGGDRIRRIPPFGPDGESPQHTAQNWGKRSIALDLRRPEERETFFALAEVADIIVENQLAGSWLGMGIDFHELRLRRPELVVCSITGFGQTGPLASLPSHGLNMDALADILALDRSSGEPRLGWSFTSWGNELGAAYAALAITAALVRARTAGEGAWIDLSCWDAHRTEIAMSEATGAAVNMHDSRLGPLYDTYLASDGRPVLLAALEPKFWKRFCEKVSRPDLVHRHSGGEIDFGRNEESLREELRGIMATVSSAEWERRFIEWDVPGGPVLEIPDVLTHPHFRARGLVEHSSDSNWPNVLSAIRWHHVDQRAGAGLAPPPELDADRDEILKDWLGL
jgi:alpha-methylacyl-CoA racemase